ncbi:hypothetical protein HID58_074819 [Brassica napus]|uniref:F-box domain-containing protein n=1 Tax=Brassica napus TaxID=3708 RepID=A0ABQ7YHZ5_BRANA|nr:hypothetical protein HID58_074819 [Brassica napus]
MKKMSNLPKDLVEKVLYRIPLSSLRTVRSTCREWNSLSKRGSFEKKHLGQKKVAAAEEFMVVMMMDCKVYLLRVGLHNVESCLKHEGGLISQARKSMYLKSFTAMVYCYASLRITLASLEVFRRLFLSLFDFTRETFGPSLPLMFEFHEMQDTLSLSSVIEEQLSVLFQPWDTLWMEIWITTKIEPNGVV